jgi:hypothetical protein
LSSLSRMSSSFCLIVSQATSSPEAVCVPPLAAPAESALAEP